jgi:hypothetical protein
VIYVKHPELGSKHVPEAELPALVAAGWVRWPRTAEQKADAPVSPVVTATVGEILKWDEPPKRKPGRPRKESP